MNLIILLIGYSNDKLFPFTVSWLGAVYSVLILALVMVLIGFVLIYLLSATWYRLRYKTILNPFTLLG
jgi:hypothetical protein